MIICLITSECDVRDRSRGVSTVNSSVMHMATAVSGCVRSIC